MTIKVFKYGLLAPTLNGDLVKDEMRKGHIYQNKLIEIECWRRDEVRKLESKYGNINELEIELSSREDDFNLINKQIKNYKSKLRTKKIESPILGYAQDIVKTYRKNAKIALSNARKLLRGDLLLKEEKDKIQKLANEKEAIARGDKENCPYSGTYMLIETAVSKTKAMPFYNGVESNNPKFKRFDGSGRIGIHQLDEKRVPIEKIVGTDPQSNWIQIVPPKSLPLKNNGQKCKIGNKDLRLLRIRVGTIDGTRKPIWAEFPMIYHRPLQGNIINIQVLRTKEGPKEIWTASISVEIEDNKSILSSKEIVAIDLGWREYNDKIVYATYKGSDGKSGELSINKLNVNSNYGLVNRLQYVNDIKSIRDKEFDKIRDQLKDWIKINSAILPEWFLEKTKTLHQWKSIARMVSLITQWSSNRFKGDDDILGKKGFWNKQLKKVISGTGLLGWKYHDYHLWDLQICSSKKARNALKECYRIEAAKLAKNYGAIIFENINGSNMAKGKVGSTNRQLLAPFEFRSACKMIFLGRGLKYEEVDAKNTSKICNDCGYVNEKTSDLQFICFNCKKEIQRDENAAKNILQRYMDREGLGDVESAGTARASDINNLNIILDGTSLAKETSSMQPLAT